MSQRRQYALLVTTVAVLSLVVLGYNWLNRPDVPMPIAIYLTPADSPTDAPDPQMAEAHGKQVVAILQSYSIDLNTADAATLTQLPRIGEVLAERIVAYRSQHGLFAKVDELIQVKGIGEATLEALRPYVYVS